MAKAQSTALLSALCTVSPASPGQVRHPLLEAAVEYKPAVLVPQGQCQELLLEKAEARGAAVGVGGLECWGTNGGAGGQETVMRIYNDITKHTMQKHSTLELYIHKCRKFCGSAVQIVL
jgi:hypothetical protein